MYAEILRELGAVVERKGETMVIDPRPASLGRCRTAKLSQLRASYYLMGALLGRFGEAVIGMPGGCNFEPRPIDQHIKGFRGVGCRQ